MGWELEEREILPRDLPELEEPSFEGLEHPLTNCARDNHGRSRHPMVIVGAPPWDVEWNLPGAWDQTKGYVARVNHFTDLIQTAFGRWATEKFGSDDSPAPTTEERNFIVDWPSWYLKWKAWTVDAQPGFDPRQTPTGVWLQTEIYEKDAKKFRAMLDVLTQGTEQKAPPDPGDLEPPGGVPGGIPNPFGGLGSGIGSALGSIVPAAVILLGGFFLLSARRGGG